MHRFIALVVAGLSLPGCGLFGPSGECEPGQTRPCSCPEAERNSRQTCDPDGYYGSCACPRSERTTDRVEAPQRSAEERAHLAVASTLSSVAAACALAQGEVSLERWFGPSVPARARAAACSVDDQGIEVYRRACSSGRLLCSDATRVTLDDVEGDCWRFTANAEVGASFVVGCLSDGRFQIVEHEGLEALRAPPRPEEEDDYLEIE